MKQFHIKHHVKNHAKRHAMHHTKHHAKHHTKYKLLLPLFCCLLLCTAPATPQVPVADYLGRWISQTASVIQKVSLAIRQTALPLVESFQKAQSWIHNARRFVRQPVQQLRYIEKIIQLEKDIFRLYRHCYDRLAFQDLNNDGQDDLDALSWAQKALYQRVLIEFYYSYAQSSFRIFEKILQPGSLKMDDRGRLQLLAQTYEELSLVKSSLRATIRRVNRDLFQIKLLQRELEVYGLFF